MQPATQANPVEGSAVYPIGSRVNAAGHLEVGGCDVVELAREFGTPAYIYAEDDIRERARQYLDAFRARNDDFEVLYASKAAPFTAAYRVLREEGLSVDVASGGELHMALRAGFDPARIHMHGNNKTEAELRDAVDAGVGHVICDSLAEIERLDAICAAAGRRQEVLIRVTPGVRAETHTYVQTGQLDSKFGLGLADGLAARAVAAVRGSRALSLVGLHAHIGSQIFELEPYVRAIEALAELADPEWCRLLNVGGGLGIAYTPRRRPALDRLLRRGQGPRRRARASTRCRGSWSSPAARSSATPGSPPTRSARSRRCPACAPTSPSTAACPTTCARCSTAPATRRSSPTAPTSRPTRR